MRMNAKLLAALLPFSVVAAPAEASALKIENGQVKLTVEVDASTDLKTWEPATTVEIDVPVEGEKGFYILRSK